ncbi:MAG TPA: prolyl oligopeptidase family serine peptidase [Myxococcota bacterium]|nr:prolyl oligopeptidase family serine peptidase [Myxococcota bacterium]
MSLLPPSLRATALAAFPLVFSACRSGPPVEKAAAPAAQSTSAEAFLRTPAVSLVTLSPDGKRVAGISSNGGVRVVFESARDKHKVNYLSKLEPQTLVHAFGWSGDGVLVVGYEQPDASGEREIESRKSPDSVVVYDADAARARRGREREYRMVALRVDTWRQRATDSSWPLKVHPSLPGAVIHWLPDDPERVLINWFPSADEGASAVIARVRDGLPKVVVPAKTGVNVWYADYQGRVRAGSGRSEDGITAVVLAREKDGAPFAELSDVGTGQQSDFEFAGFGADPKTLYVYAIGATGRRELFAYDLGQQRRGSALYANKEFDVGRLVHAPQGDALWAVEVDAEKPELYFFDRAAQREQAAIDAAFPGATNRIVSFDRAAKVAIVRTSGDTSPPDYYRYDRERRRMDFLFAENPVVDRTELSPMKPVRFTAHDGTPIPAYLTVPHGSAGKNLPVIVIVHDGPSGRVSWGWDPVVQFFASRGFAVFQPNYRGSTGYGREHERMGYGQWGLAMQDDLADGVRWLVAEGIANPTRVGIYGIGYGGYAALLAAAKSPELFRAAAGYAPVTDLVDLLDNPAHYRSADLNQPVEGKLPGDRPALAAISPARLGAQIRVPVLVAYGVADPIVSSEQPRAIVSAIEDAGRKVESYSYRRELHELVDETNRVDFHEKLAAFFARHLSAIESL